MSFHEDPDFVLITVHEEVVDLGEVVHLQQEHDQFLFAETRQFHSIPGYFSYQNRHGTRVFESLLQNQREFVFLSFKENPDSLVF